MKTSWLVTCDFSEHSNNVVESSARELVLHDGRMVLLHVYRVPPAPTMFSLVGEDRTYISANELGETLLENVTENLESMKKRLLEQFPSLNIEILIREGDAVDEILQAAKEKKVSQIVVGTHSRKGVERLFLGSVSERVVRMSPISVWVVKA